MPTKRIFGTEATDPKLGMTLDELAAWLEEAKRYGVPGDATPTAVIKIGSGRVKKIKVEG